MVFVDVISSTSQISLLKSLSMCVVIHCLVWPEITLYLGADITPTGNNYSAAQSQSESHDVGDRVVSTTGSQPDNAPMTDAVSVLQSVQRTVVWRGWLLQRAARHKSSVSPCNSIGKSWWQLRRCKCLNCLWRNMNCQSQLNLLYSAFNSDMTHTKIAKRWFLPRCMECSRGIAIGILSVCLSVRPSVKRVHCDKTEESCV